MEVTITINAHGKVLMQAKSGEYGLNPSLAVDMTPELQE